MAPSRVRTHGAAQATLASSDEEEEGSAAEQENAGDTQNRAAGVAAMEPGAEQDCGPPPDRSAPCITPTSSKMLQSARLGFDVSAYQLCILEVNGKQGAPRLSPKTHKTIAVWNPTQEAGLPGLDRLPKEEVARQDRAAQEAQAGRLQAQQRCRRRTPAHGRSALGSALASELAARGNEDQECLAPAQD